MIPSARTTLARALPATALLLAVTACTAETPSSPSSSTASVPQRTSTATAPATSTATAPATPTDKNTAMNIQLTIEGHRIDATLNDSATARDFAALLPLTLTLSDFHQTERIADLPRRLSTAGAPETAQPKAGDLAYYAPWGNLALFYRDGGSSDAGLIILGRVAAADVERLATATDVTIATAP
ncbi:cyclophilin-like fold protein [Streptomyces sp. NPDC001868]|uniref:cyclophilin-like fold protein n=1 Tax=Streptomyces sp. NPDC001868 TaxID=3154401 RepID=UPI0033283B18